MADEIRPLSQLISQGWEVVSCSAAYDAGAGAMSDSFLLRRQKQHKVLRVRRKMFGAGLVVEETDV